MDAQIGFADALRWIFLTAVAKLSRISWLKSVRKLRATEVQ